MFIRNGKRFNIYATNVEIDGIRYPHFTDPAIRASLGVTEIPDPQPPEDYVEEEYFRVEQDDAPYVVYTKKSEEQLAEIAQKKIDAENEVIKANLREIDIASIRSLREYIASKQDAPQFIKDHEANAQIERAKIK